MERSRKQKGRGFFKNVANFFSGRKTARKKAMGARNLSKKDLEKKWFKTKKNKENLSQLKAKVAPKEEVYQRRKEEELEKRWAFQKFFNRFYKPQEVPTPKKIEQIPIDGLLNVKGNTRKPFNRSLAKKSNAEIADPPELMPEQVRVINGQRIPLAGQGTVLYLNAPLLYSIWNQRTPNPVNVPESLERIPDAEYNRFPAALREALESTDDRDEVVRKIFHMPGGLEELEQWRIEHEEGRGWPDTFTVVNLEYFFGDGSSIESRRIKVAGSVSAGRLLADYRKTKKEILEAAEGDLITCVSLADRNNIVRERLPTIYTPLTTLKSNGCIQVFKSLEYLTATQEMGELGKSWIILEPEYLRFTDSLPITAKYFRSARFIQEALDNWGIQGMDPNLFELFQIKYPELAIKCSTYFLNTKDFAYQQQKLKSYDNYIVLDKEIFPDEIGLTVANPFKEASRFYPLLQTAKAQQKLYGMSPYIAFLIKKIALPLFMELFDSEGNRETMRIYNTLTRSEQITIDFLQSLRFRDKVLGSNYNFAEARDTYKDFVGEGTATEGLIHKLIELYMLEMAKNVEELEFYQKLVTRPYENELPVFLLSRADITNLLMKFKRPAPIRRPPNAAAAAASLPRLSPPGPVVRTSVRPAVPTRRSVAPPRIRNRGVFNEATSRRNTTRRLTNLNRYLSNQRTAFEEIERKYGGLDALEAKIEFLARKLRYLRGNRSRLGRAEQEAIDDYMVVKKYRAAQENRTQKLSTLERL